MELHYELLFSYLLFSWLLGCRTDGEIVTKWALQLLLGASHGSWVGPAGEPSPTWDGTKGGEGRS